MAPPSLIDYCLPVFYNNLKQTEIAQLNRPQYNAAKLVGGALHFSSADKLNKELGWETIAERAKFLGLSVYHKIHKNQTRPLIREFMPALNSRGNTKYTQFKFKSVKFDNSFYPFYSKLWNTLPLETRKLNVDDFKINIKNQIKPPKYKHLARGNKYACSLQTRIRIGRSYLNSHSFSIGRADSPKCICEHPNETSLHYITQCWLYTEERRILYEQVEHFIPKFKQVAAKRQYEILMNGYEIDNPELLHINTQIMKITQNFILKTKRFKHNILSTD
jgi:hypothetical protein